MGADGSEFLLVPVPDGEVEGIQPLVEPSPEADELAARFAGRVATYAMQRRPELL